MLIRNITLRHWAMVRVCIRVTVGVYYFVAGWPCSYHSRNPNPSHAGGLAVFKEFLLGLHFTVVFCIISTVILLYGNQCCNFGPSIAVRHS